ncbi:MAG: twin-arginine translocation signal domain-containing protein [Halovenus sp.]
MSLSRRDFIAAAGAGSVGALLGASGSTRTATSGSSPSRHSVSAAVRRRRSRLSGSTRNW